MDLCSYFSCFSKKVIEPAIPEFMPFIATNPELVPAITSLLLPTIIPSLIPILDARPSLVPALKNALVPIITSALLQKTVYTILCDNNAMIECVSNDMLSLLKFDIDTIKHRFIGVIMSLYMSMLHKQFFIGNFNSCGAIERNKLENKLKIGHRKRPILIYDIDGKSHTVYLSILYNKCPAIPLDTLSKRFYLKFDIIDEPIELFYTRTPSDDAFKESVSKIIIICVDFIDSTAILTTTGGTLLSIDNSIKFHKAIITLIRNVYYPFIYLHEVIGDSFIIALNTDWAYTSEKICASLAINFIFDLVQNTRDFVKIRTGVSYGGLHYGTIGSTFRFFGKPINMASRLENKCQENEIVIDEECYNKLVLEMKYIDTTISIDSIIKTKFYLKGFGNTDCFIINVPMNDRFIVYNN